MHAWNRAGPSLCRSTRSIHSTVVRAESSLSALLKSVVIPPHDSSQDIIPQPLPEPLPVPKSNPTAHITPQPITLPLPSDLDSVAEERTLATKEDFTRRLLRLRKNERTRGVASSSKRILAHGKYVAHSIVNALQVSSLPDESPSSSGPAPKARTLPLAAPDLPPAVPPPSKKNKKLSFPFTEATEKPSGPQNTVSLEPQKTPPSDSDGKLSARAKRVKKAKARAKEAKEKKLKLKKKTVEKLQEGKPELWDVWDKTAAGIVGQPSGKDDWSTGWGEDKLRPSEDSKDGIPKERRTPPHMPAVFSKRIEGLLEPTEGPVLRDLPPVSAHRPVATLAHGLDRVLFNPGVHWVQDPRSRVFNFHPSLQKIPKVTDFAFERLQGFIKSSRDTDLRELAHREKRTFAGSTSSLSGMLSQIYFLISEDKEVNTSRLSMSYRGEPKTFTSGQRMPASVLMNYKDGVYAIDSSKGPNDVAEKNILTWMGTLLEKYLTMEQEEFATYMRSNLVAAPGEAEEEDPEREAYRYAKSNTFVMRSQLDCKDPRLPGTGVFDIKTRACVSIRLDILNFEENSGYLIRSQHGLFESFEKEYYDLIRSAFLKYSFQVRIGNMDGVIVAYHNTERMFGFQYIPIEEMDLCLFGPGEGVGDRVFEKCIGVLEKVAEEVAQCFPEESVRCTFETLEGSKRMNVWVEPEEWDEAKGPRPIQQLEVMAQSFLGKNPVKGYRAVNTMDEPWTLQYTISHLATSPAEMRNSLADAIARQFRSFNLPSGILEEEAEAFWTGLNFGGQASTGEAVPFDADNFQTARATIEKLRAMARRGREETEQWREKERGKPRIVLGGEEVPWVEEQEKDVVLLDVKPGAGEGEGHHASTEVLEAFGKEETVIKSAKGGEQAVLEPSEGEGHYASSWIPEAFVRETSASESVKDVEEATVEGSDGGDATDSTRVDVVSGVIADDQGLSSLPRPIDKSSRTDGAADQSKDGGQK